MVPAGSGRLVCMNLPADLNALSPEQLRTLAAQLIAQVQDRDREIEEKTREVEENERELHYRQTRIEQLSHEISILKRLQFGRRSEQFSGEQMSLLEEAIDADLAAIELELEQLQPQATAEPVIPATEARITASATAAHRDPPRAG